MNEHLHVRQYLLEKRRNWAAIQAQSTPWTPHARQSEVELAKGYVRGRHRDDLVAEFQTDLAYVWNAVCHAMTVLSSDDILAVVEDVFELAAPEIGFFGELVADALLIACGLPTRWWKRNGRYVAIGVAALGLITLIGWNRRGKGA